MKKTLLISGILSITLILAFQVMSPVVLNAQSVGSSAGSNGVSTSNGVSIKNPIQANSIQELIAKVLVFVVNLLAIAGVFYILWAGLMLVMAQGNESKLEAAKKSFLNAIIGMAIILGAWAIAQVISNTINQVTQNNPSVLKP